jgi:peptidyl-prolyl cis-trans isomerase SurA
MRVQLKFMNIRAWTVIAALTAWPAGSSAEILEQIVVKVNGDIITKTEFEQRQVLALRGRNQGGALQGDALKQAIAEVTPQLIMEAVDELLLLQRGKELGFKLTDQQYQSIVEQIRKENRLDSDEAFQAALKQEGMTTTDLRRNLERQVIISNVQRQEVMQKVAFNEAEGRKYHAEHIDQFTKPGTVTLRELFVSVPGDGKTVNVGADEEAKRKIEEIRRRIMDGEDFAKVAAEVSNAASKSNGGLIGPINISELSEPLQKLLKTMKPGQVTQPIRVAKGYQILKLETLKEAALQAFDEVRDLVAEKVHAERQRQEVRKFLTRIRGQAIIEWKNQELRKAYEQLVADVSRGTQG